MKPPGRHLASGRHLAGRGWGPTLTEIKFPIKLGEESYLTWFKASGVSMLEFVYKVFYSFYKHLCFFQGWCYELQLLPKQKAKWKEFRQWGKDIPFRRLQSQNWNLTQLVDAKTSVFWTQQKTSSGPMCLWWECCLKGFQRTRRWLLLGRSIVSCFMFSPILFAWGPEDELFFVLEPVFSYHQPGTYKDIPHWLKVIEGKHTKKQDNDNT